MIYGDWEELDNTCGVNLFNYFTDDYAESAYYLFPLGGANLAVAGFKNSYICEEAYKQLAKKYHIAYQSSVRRNKRSGNMFFFVVYDGLKVN